MERKDVNFGLKQVIILSELHRGERELSDLRRSFFDKSSQKVTSDFSSSMESLSQLGLVIRRFENGFLRGNRIRQEFVSLSRKGQKKEREARGIISNLIVEQKMELSLGADY